MTKDTLTLVITNFNFYHASYLNNIKLDKSEFTEITGLEAYNNDIEYRFNSWSSKQESYVTDVIQKDVS